jgi:signal transduction histidine kinase
VSLYTTAADVRSPRLLALDGALAVTAFAATVAVASHGSAFANGARPVDWLTVVLAALASLPLALWRRSPLGVFALTTAASASLYAIGIGPGPPFGPTIALYLLAASRDDAHPWTRRTTAVVIGLFVVHVASEDLGASNVPIAPPLFGIAVWTIAWFAGDRTRLRRERLTAQEDRLARERRLAAVEERARIARDLHDSAGHAISVILVQAGAARLLQDRDPAGARDALHTIEEVARDTIGEIDQLVRTLRDDGAPANGVADALGVASLGTLVERYRAAGLDVAVESTGTPRQLGATADGAAYRIVQESLTNASRHGTGSARVELAFGEHMLELTVSNPIAPGTADAPAGHGLTGMRERALLAGGALEAGASDGTFRVHAHLPTRGAE